MSGSLREFGQKVPGITYVERPGAYAFLLNSSQEMAVIQTGFGLFLPGGGMEAGEDALTGLKREVLEEIGYEILRADLLGQAAQYHWSAFYQSHFRKVGNFFRTEAAAPAQPTFQKDHSLLWLPPALASRQLTQEFQRWAVAEWMLP